jgi:hypothetical protein
LFSFVLFTLPTSVLGSILSNGFLQVCWDHVTEWVSAGQQGDWRLWRERYARDHFGSINAASRTLVCVCVCVCALVSIKWFDCNKRGCFL